MRASYVCSHRTRQCRASQCSLTVLYPSPQLDGLCLVASSLAPPSPAASPPLPSPSSSSDPASPPPSPPSPSSTPPRLRLLVRDVILATAPRARFERFVRGEDTVTACRRAGILAPASPPQTPRRSAQQLAATGIPTNTPQSAGSPTAATTAQWPCVEGDLDLTTVVGDADPTFSRDGVRASGVRTDNGQDTATRDPCEWFAIATVAEMSVLLGREVLLHPAPLAVGVSVCLPPRTPGNCRRIAAAPPPAPTAVPSVPTAAVFASASRAVAAPTPPPPHPEVRFPQRPPPPPQPQQPQQQQQRPGHLPRRTAGRVEASTAAPGLMLRQLGVRLPPHLQQARLSPALWLS